MSKISDQTARLCRAIIFVSAAIFALTVCATAQSETSTAHLEKEHAKALQTWLKANPKYRAAQVADCKNKFGLNSMRGDDAKFHPYYAIYDFDKDSSKDFAVVVIDAKRKPDFQHTLIIFKGDARSNYKAAHRNVRFRSYHLWHYRFASDFPESVFCHDGCLRQ